MCKNKRHNVFNSLFILIVGILSFLLSGCGVEKVHSKQWLYFDTIVELKIYGSPTDETLDSIWNIADEKFALWDSLTDLYDSSSALYSLNAAQAGTVDVNSKLIELLGIAFQWRKRTNGALEPEIGHIVELWDIGGERQKIPRQSEIDSALALMKSSDVVLIENSSCAVFGDVKIDLGAFTKGFVADKLYDILLKFCTRNVEVNGFLINCGRNIRGWRRDGENFTIGIANPRGDGIIASFELPSGFGCASAGDYERFFIKDGVRYHHIFDPKTGKPACGAIAATVVAKSALKADALSTAAVILGRDIKKILDDGETTIILFDESNGRVVRKVLGNRKISFR